MSGRGLAKRVPEREQIYLGVLVAYAAVLIDQTSKALASNSGAVAQAPARNSGLFLGVHAGTSIVLIGMSAVVLVGFLTLVGRTLVRIGVPPFVPALIAGGMIGNALDRARLGAVRDFIYSPWLIFNVADVAVALGLVLTVVAAMVRAHQVKAQHQMIRIDVRRLRAEIVNDR